MQYGIEMMVRNICILFWLIRQPIRLLLDPSVLTLESLFELSYRIPKFFTWICNWIESHQILLWLPIGSVPLPRYLLRLISCLLLLLLYYDHVLFFSYHGKIYDISSHFFLNPWLYKRSSWAVVYWHIYQWVRHIMRMQDKSISPPHSHFCTPLFGSVPLYLTTPLKSQ